MISFAVRLALVLKLNSHLAKAALITTKPATPAFLNWGRPTLHDSPHRFFLMMPISQDLFGGAELVDFEHRPCVLEQLAQTDKPIYSQSAASARLGHLRCVIDAVHHSVGALQHHEAAAGPFIF